MMEEDPETGQLMGCKVQSMQIPEALGEVDHIFCDKTGTLTQNDLDVKALCIGTIVCKGDTKAALNQDVDQKCQESDSLKDDLYKCFCLCNDLRVSSNSKNGTIRYNGASQDELILAELASCSSIFSLERKD